MVEIASTMTVAKLSAAVEFGTVFAMALNAFPGVDYHEFLTLKLRRMNGRGILQLIAGHATSVVMAGLFGFFGILAIRGVCRLIVGERGFRAVSSTVHSALVVCAITALLLAPTVRKTTVRDWVAGTMPAPWLARPVLWYLGVNETLAGHIVAETPVVLPPRFSFVAFPKRRDDVSRAAYRVLAPQFAALARRAWLSVPIVACLAITTFLWNNRRLPEPSTGGRVRSRLRARIRRMAEWLTDGNPETQAGLFFTWQTLARSASHRSIVAIAVAAGCTHLLIALAASGVHRLELPSIPLGLFAINLMVLTPLVAGFRYAVTVPPELASNWTIEWPGSATTRLSRRRQTCGPRRPGGRAVDGAPAAARRPVWIRYVAVVLDLQLHVCHGDSRWAVPRLPPVPVACSYVPIENPKLLWPRGAGDHSARHLWVRRHGAMGVTQQLGQWELGVALGAVSC